MKQEIPIGSKVTIRVFRRHYHKFSNHEGKMMNCTISGYEDIDCEVIGYKEDGYYKRWKHSTLQRYKLRSTEGEIIYRGYSALTIVDIPEVITSDPNQLKLKKERKNATDSYDQPHE